jgi:hypothetical protein
MRRTRLKLWQLMIAVALIAALAFGERMRRHWAYCRRVALFFESMEGLQREIVVTRGKIVASTEKYEKSLPQHFASAERNLRDAKIELEYICRMRAFWEQAAARPWRSVGAEKEPKMPVRSD